MAPAMTKTRQKTRTISRQATESEPSAPLDENDIPILASGDRHQATDRCARRLMLIAMFTSGAGGGASVFAARECAAFRDRLRGRRAPLQHRSPRSPAAPECAPRLPSSQAAWALPADGRLGGS